MTPLLPPVVQCSQMGLHHVLGRGLLWVLGWVALVSASLTVLNHDRYMTWEQTKPYLPPFLLVSVAVGAVSHYCGYHRAKQEQWDKESGRDIQRDSERWQHDHDMNQRRKKLVP